MNFGRGKSVLRHLCRLKGNEYYWYRIIQNDCFKSEIIALGKVQKINAGSKIVSLNPYLDEKRILRVGGRATLVPTKRFNNTPIILDGIHAATRCLLAEYHRRSCHASYETVVNEIGQTYYIIGLRRISKSLTSKCIVCRIRRAKPQNPQIAPLLATRVAVHQRPFSHSGIDYFRHFQKGQ